MLTSFWENIKKNGCRNKIAKFEKLSPLLRFVANGDLDKIGTKKRNGAKYKKIGSKSDKKDQVGADFGESVGAPQTNNFLFMALA